jgi:hypothetical protein
MKLCMLKKLFSSLLFTLLSIFLTNCGPSPYQPSGATGGFNDIYPVGSETSSETDGSVFGSSFDGNGYTNTERALDLAKLRVAQRAWENGYPYFSLLAAKSNSQAVGSVGSATSVPVPWGGAVSVGSSEQVYNSYAESYIYGLTSKPANWQVGPKNIIHNTLDVITEISKKHGIEVDTSIHEKEKPLISYEKKFKKLVERANAVLTVKEPIDFKDAEVYIDIEGMRNLNGKEPRWAVAQQIFNVAQLFHQDPHQVANFYKKHARAMNSDLVILRPFELDSDNPVSHALQTVVQIIYAIKQRSNLGIWVEPNTDEHVYIIRNLSDPANSPFKLGDRILEVNGIDVVTVEQIGELYYRNSPGDVIPVKVNRKGELKTLNVKLLPNPEGN